MVVFILAVPLGERFGVPSFSTFLVVGILVLLPVELGVLRVQRVRGTTHYSST